MDEDSLDIAIVGMAGRFPKARDLEAYWRNLRDGVSCVTSFDDEEALAGGVPPEQLADPSFVRSAAPLEDADMFDAEFFGYSPREAEVMDPQHRVMLECAWQAAEAAGLDPERYDGLVGVYASGGAYGYLMFHVAGHGEVVSSLGSKQVEIGNSNDFLATRLAYKLGLEGPSVSIQCACSSSLVAVATACQELLAYQCDTALAGGVAIDVTNRFGYLHHEDGLFSPDGVCRAFDARAGGTVGGSGVGMIVLKRLEDAVAEGDHIHAVIKGSAVNNDGAHRAGFTAPRKEGQALAIATALASAGIDPETVRYVEGHGTATVLGDPIEVAALTAAYGASTDERGFCALGSVKTNIGHLDAAAGIAGLIKAVLSIERAMIPPTLHYESPNPRIDFAASPFYVNTELLAWPETDDPRRAGVSAFGLGGTNAHVVLEEAPPARAPADRTDDGEQLIVLSAKSAAALEAATDRLSQVLRADPSVPLADVAHTLQTGRRAFDHRRVLVADSVEGACAALDARDGERMLSGTVRAGSRPVAFLLPGFGDHYPNMARGLYESEPAFRDGLDHCASLLRPHLGRDLRDLLFDDAQAEASASAGIDFRQMVAEAAPSDHPLDQPTNGYAAVFAVEYACVRLWESWGVVPDALIGHSLGEYVAACVAGVLSLEDALWLTVERARLIEGLEEGAMLAVALSEEESRPYLADGVALAACNTPRSCVISGAPGAVEAVARDLSEREIASRRLNTRWAFHSPLMEPIVAPYAELVRRVDLRPPETAFLSNVSGTWITPEQATDPDYWAGHLSATVRFSDGVAALWQVPDVVMLEVGPGHTLSGAALQHQAGASQADRFALPSIRSRFDGGSDRSFLLRAAGQLWLAGVSCDWSASHGDRPRRTVPLPTYPFQRRKYWLERAEGPGGPSASPERKQRDLASWFFAPSWRRSAGYRAAGEGLAERRWLVFADEQGVGADVAGRLRKAGAEVVTVSPGSRMSRPGPREFVIDPSQPDHYERVASALRAEDGVPERVVHCWSVGREPDDPAPVDVEALLDKGFGSLLRWAQACEPELMTDSVRWDVVTSEVQAVTGGERLCPPKAAVAGICKVAPQEYPGLECQQIDVAVPGREGGPGLIDQLMAELSDEQGGVTVALRGGHRWEATFEPTPPPSGMPTRLRSRGVYVITGGLGKIGLIIARSLAQTAQARLVLLGRTGLPPRSSWDEPSHSPSVRQAIRAVEEIEALGSEVLVLRADVADPEAVRDAMGRAREAFGPINGLVHSAGTVGPQAHHVLSETGVPEAQQHFRPKIHGTLALERALEGEDLDFAVLFSSVASLLGGLGFGAYAAANAFLDALAQDRHQRGLPWTSLDWEAWHFPEQDGVDQGIGTAVQSLAMDPDEGRLVFERLLTVPSLPQVIISTTDVVARARRWSRPIASAEEQPRHARPTLRNAYVAPANEMEERIAGIWQDLLGVDEVGVHDSFFELGGSSLLGIQVVHRLRKGLQLPVPLTIVYEGPTVRALAELLSAAVAQDGQAQEGEAQDGPIAEAGGGAPGAQEDTAQQGREGAAP